MDPKALLTPRSFALDDSTQPYTLTFAQPFHQLVVQMPKAVLSRHLINPEQYTAMPISGTSGLGAVLTDFIFSLARELRQVQRHGSDLPENLVNMIAMAFSSSVMLSQVDNHSITRTSWKRRIRQLLSDLAYGGHSMDRFACSAGFVNAAHFSRAFKKRYGIRPGDVR